VRREHATRQRRPIRATEPLTSSHSDRTKTGSGSAIALAPRALAENDEPHRVGIVTTSTITRAAAALLLATGAAGCSSPHPAVSCEPPPGSCNGPPPVMSQLDTGGGCRAAPVTLNEVCDTPVDQCFPSGGLGPVCAIAPDGGVFVAVLSDNDMLTATGWRFDQPMFPRADGVPAGQMATAPDQAIACRQAMCAPLCPGVPRAAADDPASFLRGPCADAGQGGAATDGDTDAPGPGD